MVLLVFINIVINNLSSAVRELNSVLSLHGIALSLFSSGMVVGVTIGIIIIHFKSKSIILWWLLMVRLWVVGSHHRHHNHSLQIQ